MGEADTLWNLLKTISKPQVTLCPRVIESEIDLRVELLSSFRTVLALLELSHVVRSDLLEVLCLLLWCQEKVWRKFFLEFLKRKTLKRVEDSFVIDLFVVNTQPRIDLI